MGRGKNLQVMNELEEKGREGGEGGEKRWEKLGPRDTGERPVSPGESKATW